MTKRQGRIEPLKRAYSRMIMDIRDSILTGEMALGDCLPSEARLAAEYGISVNSVRRGIDILVDEGIVERRHGSGMYVDGMPAPTAQPMVRRDTVAVYFDHWIHSYHPFFSEQSRGVRDGLGRFGWKVLDIAEVAPRSATEKVTDDHIAADHDLIYLERKYMTDFLATHQELVGAILGYSTALMFRDDLKGLFPVVVPTKNDTFPYVDLDMQDETFRALQEVMRAGARKLIVIGKATAELEPVAMRAARANDPEIRFERIVGGTVPYARTFSGYITSAHNVMRDLMEKYPDTDGVVILSDFEAQGALDALAEMGRRDLSIVALINHESRIHTALPYTAVVFDGYQKGLLLAELLQQYISVPECASEHIWMRGVIRHPRKRR